MAKVMPPFFLIFLAFMSKSVCDKEYQRVGMGRMVPLKKGVVDHFYHHQAISTDSPVCSRVGLNILRQNGSAVDAAIASLVCLSAIHPHSAGIGGGGFMMVYDGGTKKTEFINFRETAPACIEDNIDNVTHKDVNSGGLSVSIPGELRGYEYAHRKYSKLPWRSLFEPTIKLLKAGIKVDDSLSIALERWKQTVLQEKSLRNIFSRGGKVLTKGDKYYNRKYSATLRKISNKGPNVFYVGFSRRMEAEIRRHGGCATAVDFEKYRVAVKDPIRFKFGGVTMQLSPAPSAGPILGLILNIFKGFGFGPSDLALRPVTVYHHLIETLKFAYANRAKLADPIHVYNITQVTKTMLSDAYADEVRASIVDEVTHPLSYYGAVTCNPLKTGTTHLVVVDKHLNVVSVTSSVNGYFGAKFTSQKYGFVYNNEMDDFCFPNVENDYKLPVSEVNFPKAGKRPQSSSVPTIILDHNDDPVMAIGGAGGSIIISATAEVLIYHLIFGMSLKQAIEHPRLHAQLTPNKVFYESKFDAEIIKALEEYGHKSEIGDVEHGVVQAIAKLSESDEWSKHSYRKAVIHSQNTKLFAEADFRKGGLPAGE